MFKKRKSYSRTIVLDSVINEKKAYINILEGCLFLSERLINKHYFQSLRKSLIIFGLNCSLISSILNNQNLNSFRLKYL